MTAARRQRRLKRRNPEKRHVPHVAFSLLAACRRNARSGEVKRRQALRRMVSIAPMATP
jgi:hypothetical protein